jgi:hypothetical protein
MTNTGGNTMRTGETTLVGRDDVVLNDSGGLLASPKPTSVDQKGGFVSDRRASRSAASEVDGH